jgi:hypothetical protein
MRHTCLALAESGDMKDLMRQMCLTLTVLGDMAHLMRQMYLTLTVLGDMARSHETDVPHTDCVRRHGQIS